MSDERLDPRAFARAFRNLQLAIAERIYGQDELIEDLLITVLAGGHALLEGSPGLGKTELVKTFAALSDLEFSRIQFTPDLMPSDIVGTTMLFEQAALEFGFQPGPVFCNVLLADEINRATPKTQSALLEAMQEQAVTISGKSHKLPEPFIALATQNPIEMEGTYPLPEAQLDRFLFKLIVPRPDGYNLARIIKASSKPPAPPPRAVFSREDILYYRGLIKEVPLASSAVDSIVKLIEASHQHPQLRLGASPRAGQAIALASKAYAFAAGRPNVELEDIRRAAKPALRHRLLLGFDAEIEGVSSDDVIDTLLREVF